MITATHDLDRLNRDIAAWQQTVGATPEEALIKQGTKLGFFLSRELRGIAPAKGHVRATAMARLEAGGGIYVRPSIRERVYARLGVRQEVNTRRTVFGKRGVGSVTQRGRRLNVQALAVRAEINRRESARGFTAHSARFRKLLKVGLGDSQRVRSRYGPILSEAGLRTVSDGKFLRFEWGIAGEMSSSAAEGITTPGGQEAVTRAIQATAADIEAYLARKLDGDFRRHFL